MSSDIPLKERTFQIEIEGNLTKHLYTGEFRTKIMNIKERAQKDKHCAFLDGPNSDKLSPSVLWLHLMISHLRYSLVSFPEWWSTADLGYELLDSNVVKEVYEQVMSFEKEWTEAIWGPTEDAEDEPRPTEES